MDQSVLDDRIRRTWLDHTHLSALALRIGLIIDGLVFITAAGLNLGAQVPLGPVTLAFPVRIVPAGVGEAVIGLALLRAAASQHRGLAWPAFWLSVAGIGFGLVATTVGSGPVWGVHLVLVPLALVVLGLLVWTGRSDAHAGANPRRSTAPRIIIPLMVLTAITLLVASTIHFGPQLPFGGFGIADQFDSAAVPEATLGILLALGAAYLASGRSGSREMALAATIFTLLLALFGLSLTLPMARTGDVVYHIVLVVLLGAIIVGLAVSIARGHSRDNTLTVGS